MELLTVCSFCEGQAVVQTTKEEGTFLAVKQVGLSAVILITYYFSMKVIVFPQIGHTG